MLNQRQKQVVNVESKKKYLKAINEIQEQYKTVQENIRVCNSLNGNPDPPPINPSLFKQSPTRKNIKQKSYNQHVPVSIFQGNSVYHTDADNPAVQPPKKFFDHFGNRAPFSHHTSDPSQFISELDYERQKKASNDHYGGYSQQLRAQDQLPPAAANHSPPPPPLASYQNPYRNQEPYSYKNHLQNHYQVPSSYQQQYHQSNSLPYERGGFTSQQFQGDNNIMYQVNKFSNREGLVQDRDPDIWEPPNQNYDKYGKPLTKKRSESQRPNYQQQGRGLNFVRQVRGTNNNDAIARRKQIQNKYSIQGANPAALNGKKGYNAGGKKSNANNQNQSEFLLHHYPDGAGPDQELIRMLEKDMLDKNPNVNFGDIAQLKDAKTVLQEAVLLPLAMPQYFQGIRRPWKGVLLFGPPGTGKTMLAKALATQGKTRFFNVSASSLASKWRGDAEKLVRLLFEMARFYAPTVLFFDQIDALASKRGGQEHEASRRLKTELFVQIDGVCQSNSAGADSEQKPEERKMVMVLGATNRPWDLDEAMIRRLEKRIYIPLPTVEGRKQLLKLNLKNVKIDEKDMNYETLVKRTQNYSGADISNLCRQAAMMPMRDKLTQEIDFDNLKSLQDQINRALKMKDFLQALKNVKRSVGTDYLGQYSKWFKQFGSV